MKAIKQTGVGILALVAASAVPWSARAQDQQPPGGEPPPVVAPAPEPPPGYAPPPPAYQPPPPQGYAPGYPPPGYPPPGYPPGAMQAPAEPTHSGVYVHLHLGGGFTSISGKDAYGNSLKISGSGPSFAVAVGGAIAPNLALFGNLFLTGPSQPHVTSNGYDQGQSSGSAFVGGFGGGIVYYFMPVNIYVSGVVGAVTFEADDSSGNTTYQSDTGVGFEGMVGKEWWVSGHWGLGAAFEFVGASMKDKNDSSITWTASAFNLVFSASCF